MKQYQAWAKGGAKFTANTPRAAAEGFFSKFPDRRKCRVTEGEYDGFFFTVTYGRGQWPQSWKDVTRKSAADLPDTAPASIAAVCPQ